MIRRTDLTLSLALLALATALPAQDPTLRERAAAAERRGEYSAAADLYIELTREAPNDPDLYLAAGNCLGRSGRYNDALDLLEGVRKRFPDVLELHAMIARTYSLKARSMLDSGVRDAAVLLTLEDAIRAADAILQKQPGHLEALLILGQCHLDLGDNELALARAEEVVKRHPNHPGGHILVGTVSFNRFVQTRQRIVDEKPSGQELAELQGIAKAARDRCEQALLQATRVDPERALAQGKLGDLFAWEGDLEKAASRYAAALGVDPDVSVPHDWIRTNVKPARRVQLYEEAAGAYTAKPNTRPEKRALLDFYLGLAWYDQSQWKKARPAFVAAVTKNSTFLNAHYYAMRAAYWDGQHDDAIRSAAAFAKAAPRAFADLIRSLPDAQQSIAILEFAGAKCYREGRQDESRDLNQVLALVLDTDRHWNNYAFLCRETGQFEASYEAYRRALEKAPDSPQLLNDAAVILQYHLATPENLQTAREMYTRAIAAAEKQLADDATPQDQKAIARTALTDARNNLALLPK